MIQWAKNKNSGFTIVELLIVVVVIAILAAITIVAYNGISGRSKISALQSDLSQAAKVLDTKKNLSTTGQYPATLVEAGIKSDKLTYNLNTRSNTYCIDGKDGAAEYSVRGAALTVAEGSCITQGMAVWLPFNGSTNDASGNEHSVSSSNAPAPTTGANGDSNGAYALNGTNQFFTIQNPDSIPARTDRFTVSVWARGLSTSSNYSYIVHKGSTTNVGNSALNIGTVTGAAQNIMASVNGEHVAGNTGISSNGTTWHNTVLVYAGGYQTGYVDGVQRFDTSIGTITNALTSTNFTIGAGVGNFRPFAGTVDDFRIYNRPLTANEVTKLYEAGAQ